MSITGPSVSDGATNITVYSGKIHTAHVYMYYTYIYTYTVSCHSLQSFLDNIRQLGPIEKPPATDRQCHDDEKRAREVIVATHLLKSSKNP